MENVEPWISHSAMSDTGRHASAAAELPSSVGALNRVVQGVIIHSDWLGAYGLDASRFDRISRDTLPVAERLALILGSDARALDISRAPALRTVGTCRDFALMLCAFLRGKGIPARLRCGFADYLAKDWEDHWVCEYWDWQAQCWRLSDAQLDEVLQEKCRIAFDPSDTPRHQFMTAGQVWTDCHAGKLDPDRFGHGTAKGSWFVKINVLRDHYAVNNRETSVWDSWRAAHQSKRIVSDQERALLDDLAARPVQPIVDVDPDWQM